MNQKTKESIYWKMYESIENVVFEELYSKDKNIECDGYHIKIYRPNESEEDKQYISINRKKIFKFMNDGYIKSGQGTFKGCGSSSDIKKKATEVKIAVDDETNEYIAISIYSSYLGGYKCVGLTVTTDDSLRDNGKNALKEIIKYDINHYKSFYWMECSHSIEHYYDKFRGFKIPNAYVREILNSQTPDKADCISSLSEDGYHYVRHSNALDRDFEKVIYGFNTEDVYNKIITEQEAEFKKWIQRFEQPLNESIYDGMSKLDAVFMIVDIFYSELADGRVDFPPYAMDTLRKCKDVLWEIMNSDVYYNGYSDEDISDEYDVVCDYLEYFNELILYKFE